MTQLETFYHGLRQVVQTFILVILGGLVVANIFVMWQAKEALKLVSREEDVAKIAAISALGKFQRPVSISKEQIK